MTRLSTLVPDRRTAGVLRPIILAFAALTAFLAFWQIALTAAAPQRTVIPTPLAIVQALVSQADSFQTHTLATGQVAVVGFVLGCTIAIAMAVLSLAIRPLEGAVLRLGLALYAAPIIVVAPLIVLWLGHGLQARAAISALACFFIVLVNAIRGLKAVTRESQELLHVLSASPIQAFLKLRVPSSLPYLLSALRVAAAAAVLGAIIGEWVSAERGLGVVLFYSLFQFEVARLWAGMLLTTLLAMSGYALVGLVERVVLPWHESVRVARLESRG